MAKKKNDNPPINRVGCLGGCLGGCMAYLMVATAFCCLGLML